jgi:hypothetical protein
MKKILIIFLISFSILGKDDVNILEGYNFTPDPKLVETHNPKAPIWIPILETIGANLLLGGYNKYISNSSFAQISFDSIKENFEYGWNWDADNFFTNMWGHPFQGSIYFNTARSNGYNYWESLLMSAFGSLQWEYFMEIEHPSINDLVMTSLQGAIFGEVFYRISSLIIDETTPKKRIWRELGVVGFNPSRALNRVVYARSFRTINDNLYETKPYRVNMLLGVNDHSRSDLYNTQKRRGFFGLKYLYGDLFKQKKYKPMDIFNLDMELQAKPEISIVKFRIYGVLWAKGFDFMDTSKLIIGIFHYTDYLKNDIFNIGAVNIGPGINYLSPSFWYGSRIMLNTTIAFIPMSGVNSNYAKEFIPDAFDEGRDYNLSTGISARGQFVFLSKYVVLKLSHSFWSFWTLQGATGKEVINIFEPAIVFNLHKHLKLGLEFLMYYRSGKYLDFDNIKIDDQEARLFLSVSF